MKKHSFSAKLLAFILILAVLVPLFSTAALADGSTAAGGADYTTVFVHGLLGWGDEDGLSDLLSNWGMLAGDMPEYLRGKGYDIYVASIGPVSSAWDRCCELFAQLTGTRVDYGQAHAEKCTAEYAGLGYTLTHSRYGRDYTGMPGIEGWGPVYDASGKATGAWYDNKINLVGHSFGGPTCLSFLQLLEDGDPDEIAWGKAQAAQLGGDWHDYVSPLFWGGHDGRYLVNSVTSLAGVLNGTTFISANDDAMALLKDLSGLLANGVGVSAFGDLYDFQQEQFGLTKSSRTDLDAYFSLLNQKGFIKGSDHAFYDLSIEGTNRLKQGWETYDNVYYFSYAGDKSYTALGGNQLPDADMCPLFMPFSAKMGSYVNKNELVYDVNGAVCGYADRSWQVNDGMVNTVSSRYPFGAPHKDYDAAAIEPGVWNVLPDRELDHFAFIGGLYFPKAADTRALFAGMMADIDRCTAVEADRKLRLDAPTIWSAGKTLLGKPVLNWTPVVGAARYEIYRSTAEDGSFVKIEDTLLTLYTDLSAKARTTYYYRVVAVPLSSRLAASDFSAAVRVK